MQLLIHMCKHAGETHCNSLCLCLHLLFASCHQINVLCKCHPYVSVAYVGPFFWSQCFQTTFLLSVIACASIPASSDNCATPMPPSLSFDGILWYPCITFQPSASLSDNCATPIPPSQSLSGLWLALLQSRIRSMRFALARLQLVSYFLGLFFVAGTSMINL